MYDDDQAPEHRIRFRIGINIGDVIADGTDLHGEGTNIAARLEAASPVGGICVSRAVRDHMHGRFDLVFEPIGALALKNIARPVDAFVLRLDAETQEPVTEAALARYTASSHIATDLACSSSFGKPAHYRLWHLVLCHASDGAVARKPQFPVSRSLCCHLPT